MKALTPIHRFIFFSLPLKLPTLPFPFPHSPPFPLFPFISFPLFFYFLLRERIREDGGEENFFILPSYNSTLPNEKNYETLRDIFGSSFAVASNGSLFRYIYI
jgi:hypothetical protein